MVTREKRRSTHKELQEEVARLKCLIIALYEAGDWVKEDSHEVIYVCAACEAYLFANQQHEDDCPVAAAQQVISGNGGE